MTIGTATVASTKVGSSGGSVFSQSPSARLSTVRVGKTASQIISASWVVSDHGAGGEGVHGGADVLIDEVAVDSDGGRGTLAGGGDDLGARNGDIAGDPDAADAG